MVMGRWLDLVSLMLTSAEVVFSKVSEKGTLYIVFFSPIELVTRVVVYVDLCS